MTATVGPDESGRAEPRRPRRPVPLRLVSVGLVVILLSLITGWVLEWIQLGSTDEAAAARVEHEVRVRLDGMMGSLQHIAAAVTERTDLVGPAADDTEATRELFALLARTLARVAPGESAATVYGSAGVARAWSGRPAEIPAGRVSGPEAFFVVPSPLGLRLFYVKPIADPAHAGGRLGAVAAELALSPPIDVAALAAEHYQVDTELGPVNVRTRYEGAGEPAGPGHFLIRSPLGEPLLAVEIPAGMLAQARTTWYHTVTSIALMIAAVMMLLLIGPVLDTRLRAREARAYLGHTALAVGALLAARALLWLATPAGWSGGILFAAGSYASAALAPLLRSPLDFLATALALAGVVAILAPAVGQLRRSTRVRHRHPDRRTWMMQVVAGLLLAGLLAGHQLFLRDAVDNTSINTLRFSFHPWDVPRLAFMAALVFFQSANLWICTLLLVGVGTYARADGDRRSKAVLLVCWLAPVAVLVAIAQWRGWSIPPLAVALSAMTVVTAARLARRVLAWYRHTSQASRLVALLVVLLGPALLLYPAMLSDTIRAKRLLIEHDFAPQPADYPQELQETLEQTKREIDRIPDLADLAEAAGSAPGGGAPTDSAFRIWSQTALARQRLTSAIEIYGENGTLVSRFALNLPEYTSLAQTYRAGGCGWEPTFGLAVPFGSEERRMLHAELGICVPASPGSRLMRIVGTIVVHVMLDYRTLPFLTSQSPYLEIFRGRTAQADEAARGADVELVIYGWGHLPIYTSGTSAWSLDEALFDRIYRSREPFWATLPRGDQTYDVFFSNNRYGIYALGYPTLTVADHLESLAELATLAGVLYVLMLMAGSVFTRVARSRARLGSVLLREIRASFYRKLFLAFVLASIVPVLTLALVARTYFATKLRADVEAQAARGGAVAQRVIEEFAALQQRGAETLVPLNDDLMVLISQMLNQDVNIFEGPRLVATSERDLFASGLLPQRTPSEVFRAVRLQRLPSFVGEDVIAGVRYMLAAAPVEVAGHDAILTVPQALRQREIEREIDDLDRGIHLAALFFILLGAGIGLSMAERIADPVRRLTRATRRVARGDFDARILVRSADELQRLVDAFNTMAAELKTQAVQLERTHRLEAWAEMARQVAHEIKNPLTPIQLSAEHLRRVHADRGEPLAPVLDGCIDTILRQVRLLRQISGEFSAFASAPTPQPAPVPAAALIEEVLGPYRAGLGTRVRLETSVPAELPRLHVDRTLVSRAIVNVIENALHAMPGEGVLTVRAEQAGEGVAFEFIDTGVGMDPEALARIFEPYFSTRTTGTGLGLTIAKRNIESSGGTITVTSVRGQGTTVRLWLPATDGASPAMPG